MTDFERDFVAFWRAHPDELLDELHRAMREKTYFDKRVALLWEARWPDKAPASGVKDWDSLATAQHIRVANGVFKTTLLDLPHVVGIDPDWCRRGERHKSGCICFTPEQVDACDFNPKAMTPDQPEEIR